MLESRLEKFAFLPISKHMSLEYYLILFMFVVAKQQHVGPCESVRLIEDDWRYPSEENKRKCDNRLRPGIWYKFKYRGHSAIVAQGPIKENHCSTSGPISISLQSDAHLYPPPKGQSALYKACVHVIIMGVVTCADHLTIPLLVMTCHDNDVIYFVNKTIRECPSAFCITGREESVDRYYLIDASEDSRYFSAETPDHHNLDISQLTSVQMDDVVTMETVNHDKESVARMEDLKRHIAKALNLKSWSNCLSNASITSSSCLDYQKSIIRSSITYLGNIISGDPIDNLDGVSPLIDAQEEVKNASSLSYESSMMKFASSLCQVQAGDVKVVNLRPRTIGNITRSSLYVESFCGITKGSDLMRSLIWLNSTMDALYDEDVVSIYRGLPIDQLPTTRNSELQLNSSVWVVIFCCCFLVVSSVLLIYSYFNTKCIIDNHMIQREKILVIDCDGKAEWMSGPNKRRFHNVRGRCDTLSSTSKEIFQLQTSSTNARKLSSASKSTVMSLIKTPPFRRLPKTGKLPVLRTEVKQSSSRKNSRQPSHVEDNMGWMVPLREFKLTIPIPKLVVDTKRRNCKSRSHLNTQII